MRRNPNTPPIPDTAQVMEGVITLLSIIFGIVALVSFWGAI